MVFINIVNGYISYVKWILSDIDKYSNWRWHFYWIWSYFDIQYDIIENKTNLLIKNHPY